MSLYDISIPQMARVVGQVHRWLDKAQSYAEQKKFDPQVLLTARLAPDQWPLSRQIQIITLAPQRLGALLRGLPPPSPEESETTLPALRERVDAALEHLKALKPEEFQGAEERVIPLFFMPGKGMKAQEFVVQFALPNFYFHAVTAYAILRHNGVDVGKMDFLGELNLLDV
ncbi:MAG TPA: DUF1993 domain-containing protein [Polyangiaceae bacterium]|jgi:hypothetical protein|nr:DUF1993 domain-containing protein [Polyangiaceae bacterium]